MIIQLESWIDNSNEPLPDPLPEEWRGLTLAQKGYLGVYGGTRKRQIIAAKSGQSLTITNPYAVGARFAWCKSLYLILVLATQMQGVSVGFLYGESYADNDWFVLYTNQILKASVNIEDSSVVEHFCGEADIGVGHFTWNFGMAKYFWKEQEQFVDLPAVSFSYTSLIFGVKQYPIPSEKINLSLLPVNQLNYFNCDYFYSPSQWPQYYTSLPPSPVGSKQLIMIKNGGWPDIPIWFGDNRMFLPNLLLGISNIKNSRIFNYGGKAFLEVAIPFAVEQGDCDIPIQQLAIYRQNEHFCLSRDEYSNMIQRLNRIQERLQVRR